MSENDQSKSPFRMHVTYVRGFLEFHLERGFNQGLVLFEAHRSLESWTYILKRSRDLQRASC